MTHHKTRPAHARPGSSTNARQLGERLRVSRERLAGSELATIGRAWRLWAACVDATVGYAREADKTYATTLGRSAGIDRWAASDLLRHFDALEVFVWEAAPRGSRGISELRLPSLHTWCPDHVKEPHVVPTPRVEESTRGAQTSLQSNTSDLHRSIGNAIETEKVELGTGTPESGTPGAGRTPELRSLEGMTVEELHEGMAKYAPTIAELYAAELKRRNIAPRRRPAWLDD